MNKVSSLAPLTGQPKTGSVDHEFMIKNRVRGVAPPASGPAPRVSISVAAPNDVDAIMRFIRDFSGASRRSKSLAAAFDRAIGAEILENLALSLNGISIFARDRDSARGVGHAIAIWKTGGVADVALAVADGYQNHGIGGRLLEELMRESERQGRHCLAGEGLPNSGGKLEYLAVAGYTLMSDLRADVLLRPPIMA
jgi:GNAT superfamily N-acetyltransferase